MRYVYDIQGASAKDAQIMSVNNFYCLPRSGQARGACQDLLKSESC